MAPLGPNGQMIGIVPPPHLVMERPHSAVPSKIYEKLGESKKRQRPKTAEPSKNPDSSSGTPPTRFVKAQTKQSNSKHKFFRSRKEKERDNVPPPMGSLSASTHQLHKEIKPTSQPSFFNMRYKSLTNLAHQVKTMTMAIVGKKLGAHRSSPHSSSLYFTLLYPLLFLIHPPHLFTTPVFLPAFPLYNPSLSLLAHMVHVLSVSISGVRHTGLEQLWGQDFV